MANVSDDPYTWSSTAGSNQPDGSDTPTVDDDLRAIQAGVKAAIEPLTSVAGTNTITASHATLTAYANGQRFIFLAANSNTGATTLNINSLGAKAVRWHNSACIGGEIQLGCWYEVIYESAQSAFQIIASSSPLSVFFDSLFKIRDNADNTKQLAFQASGITTATTRTVTVPDRDFTANGVLGTSQATTSGTSWDFTIPAGTEQIEVMFAGFSINGTANPLIQIGDSGGVETTGYLGGSSSIGSGNVRSTSGFLINSNLAANVLHGSVRLTLADSSTNTWVASGTLNASNADSMYTCSGSKALSATITTVRVTTSNGTDAGDAGLVNVRCL